MEKYIRNTPINVNGVRNKVKNHLDYIKRMKLIKAFMKDDNFKREEIQNHSVPLTWEYNRNGNWLRFYPNK